MKSITIGRDESCDIIVNDPSNVVSRQHATLQIEGNGKMFIIDQSANGTKINGMRITSNIPVPVSRKNVISFADVYDLDWKLIPNQRAAIIKTIMFITLGVIVVLGLLFMFVINTKPDPKPDIDQNNNNVIVNEDELKSSLNDSIKKIKEEIPVFEKLVKEYTGKYSRLDSLCSVKVADNKLEKAKKTLYPIEGTIKSINIEELNKDIRRIEDCIPDGNLNKALELISETRAKLNKYYADCKTIEEKLEQSSREIEKLPNKKAKKPDTQKQKKETPKEDNNVMTPKIII